MKLWISIGLLIIFSSCNKEPLLDASPALVGNWTHYTDAETWHTLHVNSDGNGTMEWYTNSKLNKDTKERPWLIKDNTLYFGKVSFNGELYDIDAYPQLSGSTTIENYDTLSAGERFIILDGFYYTED